MCFLLSCLLHITVQVGRWPLICMVNQTKLGQNVFLGRLGSWTKISSPIGSYTSALSAHSYSLLSGVLSNYIFIYNFQCLRLIFTFSNGCPPTLFLVAFLPIPQFVPENICVCKSVRLSSVLIVVSLLCS